MTNLIRILFWIAVALDAGAIGLIFVLGLAAAGPSKTNPLAVVGALLIVPGLVLAGLVAWFHLSRSNAGRLGALAVVSAPVLLVVLGLLANGVVYLFNPAARVPMSVRPVPLTELENAVLGDDLTQVAAAAEKVGLRGRQDGSGVVLLVLYRLKDSPDKLLVLRALLDAGADPEGQYGEKPLETAIKQFPQSGPEPIRLLLAAGAKPASLGPLGVPVFFAATATNVDVEILGELLDRGAGVDTPAVDRSTALTHAARAGNWKAAALLLRRGAKPDLQPAEGQSFRQLAEAALRRPAPSPELEEVRRLLGR